VTTRRRNFGDLNDLGRDFGLPPALLFGLGMLGFDTSVPPAFRLAASRLPASDLPQAFRGLAVALVPAPWLVLASASFAKASPRARSEAVALLKKRRENPELMAIKYDKLLM
jgi:hypothetical protein